MTNTVCDRCREPLGERRMVVAFYPYGGMDVPPIPQVDLCLPCWREFLRLAQMPYTQPPHVWVGRGLHD